MDAADVARLGVDAVERGDARCVPGAANRMLAGLAKYLPDGLARALVESRSRDFRDAE
jgi:short-subunit dehydrogenase